MQKILRINYFEIFITPAENEEENEKSKKKNYKNYQKM